VRPREARIGAADAKTSDPLDDRLATVASLDDLRDDTHA
jgi:hypothetical protein